MAAFSGPEPEPRIIRGKSLRCLVCDNDHFFERKAQLNTAAASFLGFDWANATGTCLVCSNCGYIHWFLHE